MKLYCLADLNIICLFLYVMYIFAMQAFQAFDKQCTGRIHSSDLRRLLDNFCFKMTTDQYKTFLGTLTVSADGQVDYTGMMENINGPISDMFVSTSVLYFSYYRKIL